MKYIKKINLIDTTENKKLKKEIEETYEKGNDYYNNVEKDSKNKNT